MSLGNRLKILRENKGWNKKEAANRLGIVYTTYTGYESDEREPGHSFLITAAKLYGVTTDYLLGLTDSMYIEAAYEGKIADLPEDEQQEIEDYIEFRHQKWLKEHGKS